MSKARSRIGTLAWTASGLLLLLLPLILRLAEDGAPLGHDRDVPYLRVRALHEAWAAGQWPPRWFDAFDGGYGSPYPTFYGMSVYQMAALLVGAGVPLGASLEIVLVGTFAIGAVGVFLLVRRLVGSVEAGALAAVLFTYAPYHLFDAFGRGAYSELGAFAWFPWIALGLHDVATRGRGRSVVLAAAASAALVLTHNLMTLVFLPLIALWPLVVLGAARVGPKERWRRFGLLVATAALALGLSATFWLPMLLAREDVRLDYFLQFDVRQALIAPRDLVYTSAASHYPREAGIVHLACVAAAWGLVLRRLRPTPRRRALVFATAAAGFLLALTQYASAPVWMAIPGSSVVQFPWRLLAPASFFLSIVGACAIVAIPGRPARWLGIVAVTAALLALHHPLLAVAATVPETSLAARRTCHEVAGTQDYRPRTSRTTFLAAPARLFAGNDAGPLPPCPSWDARVVSGHATIHSVARNGAAFTVDVEAAEPAQLVFAQYAYPSFVAAIDGTPVGPVPHGPHGLLSVATPRGRHRVEVAIAPTAAERAGDWISLCTLLGVALVPALARLRRRHRSA